MGVWFNSLLQQPGPKKFKLSKIELIYKAKTLKFPRSLSKLNKGIQEDWGFQKFRSLGSKVLRVEGLGHGILSLQGVLRDEVLSCRLALVGVLWDPSLRSFGLVRV